VFESDIYVQLFQHDCGLLAMAVGGSDAHETAIETHVTQEQERSLWLSPIYWGIGWHMNAEISIHSKNNQVFTYFVWGL